MITAARLARRLPQDASVQFRYLLAVLIAITLLTTTVASILVSRKVQKDAYDDHVDDLRRTAALAAHEVAAHGRGRLQEEIDRIAQLLETRITIISRDGRVLGDSHRDTAAMESYADREEVLEALQGRLSAARRKSTAGGIDTVYVAVPLSGAGLDGVARAARPFDEVYTNLAVVKFLAVHLAATAVLIIAAGGLMARRAERIVRGLMTEAATAVERLRESERRLEDAQQLANVGSWEWDLRTNAVTWSDQEHRILGYEPGAITPSHEAYLKAVHPDDRQFTEAQLRHAVETGETARYDQRIVRPDGSVRVVHSRADVIRDAHGAPLRMRGTAQDVTERRRVEEALRQSEERFQLAGRATNDALWDWDIERNTLWRNEAFFRQFGSPATQPVIESWVSLTHPDDAQRVASGVREFLESDGELWSAEYRIRRPDGSYVWVFDRGFVVRDASGKPLRMIGSMLDITERKRAERLKSDFVSFVSHQLRTPLSGMNWMLELAADTPGLPVDAREYIRDARESAGRLGTLVNDLLDIARLESGRAITAPGAVRLDELTRSVAAEMQPLVAEKGHILALHLDGAPEAWADPPLVRQAIANLLSNAVKYTPPGGRIDVRLGQDGDSVAWTVRDNGMGIPGSAQARLFEKFYRADNAMEIEAEGTGLGLHLTRLIVGQAGGRIWCDSQEGHGSTFTFTLPVATAAKENA